MNTKSVKRVSRAAAILTVPVAAALVMSSASASAAAGDVTVTTTVEYDYTIAETSDGNGTLDLEGEIPLYPSGGEASAALVGEYETDDYLVGFEQDLTGNGGTTVYGEVYPTDELTLGAEYNLQSGASTVYADYETDTFGVGGELSSDGSGGVYGEVYPADGLTVGAEYTWDQDGNGDLSLYADYEVNDNLTVGGEYSVTSGEGTAYAEVTTPLGEGTDLVTTVEYDFADGPQAPEEA